MYLEQRRKLGSGQAKSRQQEAGVDEQIQARERGPGRCREGPSGGLRSGEGRKEAGAAATAGGERRDSPLPQAHHGAAPGASATPVLAAGLWCALPRLTTHGSNSNSFATFLRSLTQKSPLRPCGGTSATWPTPMPYPNVFFRGQREGKEPATERGVKQAVNLAVACLSWLKLGQPTAAPPEMRDSRLRGERQRQTARRIEAVLREVLCQPMVTPENMGRVAPKVESFEDAPKLLRGREEQLRSSSSGGYRARPAVARPIFDPSEVELGEVPGGAECPAKPIKADRLEFAGRPSFDPRPFLDKATAHHYEFPMQVAKPEAEAEARPPRARILGEKGKAMRLLRKLDETGRLSLLPVSECRQTHLNGLFAVQKTSTEIA